MSPAPELPPLHVLSLDPAIGRKIVDVHIWAVREGLRGLGIDELFDGFCQRLVIEGLPLWRAFAGMRTLHPQWGGYSYTWRRDLNAIEHDRFARGVDSNPDWVESPFRFLVNQIRASDDGVAWMRRRLEGPDAQLDFPVLKSFAAEGATDYFAQFFRFGPEGDPSRGTGVAYSFATDQPDGFTDDDLALLRGVLPAASIAMMAKAAHTIARSLLEAYVGGDAGRRVHAGAIERGSVETIRAVLWFADVRGFTGIADAAPGPVLIELLDGMFETLTAALRPREGQVLKFLGDGMLAIFPFTPDTKDTACQRALDAATEAMAALAALNDARRTAGKPVATVDLARHAGEVPYGNVGAIDRLDFTARMVNETLRGPGAGGWLSGRGCVRGHSGILAGSLSSCCCRRSLRFFPRQRKLSLGGAQPAGAFFDRCSLSPSGDRANEPGDRGGKKGYPYPRRLSYRRPCRTTWSRSSRFWSKGRTRSRCS